MIMKEEEETDRRAEGGEKQRGSGERKDMEVLPFLWTFEKVHK
jgi:hypothetical protein